MTVEAMVTVRVHWRWWALPALEVVPSLPESWRWGFVRAIVEHGLVVEVV